MSDRARPSSRRILPRFCPRNLSALRVRRPGTACLVISQFRPELGRDLNYPVSVGTDGKDRITAFKSGAPRLGEHTREVLLQAGLTDAEIGELAAQNVL